MGANAKPSGVGGNKNGAGATAAPKREQRLTVNWTAEEQAILEVLLNKIKRVEKEGKMTVFQGKKKDKKERAIDSSAKPSSQSDPRTNAPPYSLSMLQVDNDDISYEAIDGLTGALLERTAQIFNQISGNFTNFQINDNFGLLFQARENIHEVMNELNDIHGVMKLMPQLPVKLDEELANAILPITIIPTTPVPPQA